MGGTTFDHFQRGADPSAAYDEAVREAAHEYGHGGYSGTIKEKSGYVVITRTPMSLVEARQLADKLIDEDDERISDKWGPAGAIPVFTGERTVSVKVAEGYNDEWSVGRGDPKPDVLAVLKAAKVLKRGETVQTIHLSSYTQVQRPLGSCARARFTNGIAIVTIRDAFAPTERKVKVSIMHSGKVDHTTRSEWEPAIKAKVKLNAHEQITGIYIAASDAQHRIVAAANSKLKPQTRYVIPGTKHADWANGFDTQAEARAAAVEMAESPYAPEELHVVGLTKRQGNVPLVLVSRQTKKTLATFEVTILKVPPRPSTEPDGWLFFGWASC